MDTKQPRLPKIKNEVDIPLEDATYTLRFDLGALDALETKRDESVAEIFKESLDDKGQVKLGADGRPVALIRTGVILDLLWAGLLAHHNLSREDVGHLFGFTDLQDTSRYVMQALSAANQTNFPKDETEAKSPLRKK